MKGLRLPSIGSVPIRPLVLYPATVILTMTIAMMSIDLVTYLGSDYSTYFTYGFLINKGLLPYRDIFDFHTPLFYLFLAAWQRIFGSSFFSAKGALFFVYFGWGLSLYFFSRALVSRSSSLFSALLGLYLVARPTGDPARNGAALLFTGTFELLAVGLLIRSMAGQNRRRVAWLSVAAGVSAGLGLAARQTAIAPILFVLGLGLVQLFFRQKKVLASAPWPVFSKFWAGLGAVGLLGFAGTLGLGLLPDAFDQLFVFSRSYAVDSFSLYEYVRSWLGNFRRVLPPIIWFGIALWFVQNVLALLNRSDPRNQSKSYRAASQFLLVGVGNAAFLASVLLSVKTMQHYSFQYVASACTTAVLGFGTIRKFLQIRSGSGIMKEMEAVVTTVLIYVFLPSIYFEMVGPDLRAYSAALRDARQVGFDYRLRVDWKTAELVREITSEADPIFMFGGRDNIFWFANRISANRYYTGYLLFLPYVPEAEFREAMRRMVERPPEVVVVWGDAPRDAAESDNVRRVRVRVFRSFLADEYERVYSVSNNNSFIYAGESGVEVFRRLARKTGWRLTRVAVR